MYKQCTGTYVCIHDKHTRHAVYSVLRIPNTFQSSYTEVLKNFHHCIDQHCCYIYMHDCVLSVLFVWCMLVMLICYYAYYSRFIYYLSDIRCNNY